MSLFNNNVMGYGSMARKYGEYAAYYPHYDSFSSSATSPSVSSASGAGAGAPPGSQWEAWPPPPQDLHHVQHSMSSYYPHHPAFLPAHHGPTARDFREAAAAQVGYGVLFVRETTGDLGKINLFCCFLGSYILIFSIEKSLALTVCPDLQPLRS